MLFDLVFAYYEAFGIIWKIEIDKFPLKESLYDKIFTLRKTSDISMHFVTLDYSPNLKAISYLVTIGLSLSIPAERV